VKEGKVSMKTLDAAVGAILYWKFRIGLFDDPYMNCDPQREKQNVFTTEHRLLSRQAAQRSVVLLKNSQQVLPLQQNQKIALIGHFAASSEDIFDFWVANAKSDPYKPSTLLDGLKEAGVTYAFAKGYDEQLNTSDVMIQEAITVANASDIVVVNIGISGKLAGEDRSIAMPEIPEAQLQLLKALRNTGKKIVAVISAGRPLVLTKAKPFCDAIVYAWILGTEQGNALTDVLYGKYNPSAKTVMSFPYAVGQIPVYYNHMNTSRPNPTDGQGNWYSRYRDIPNEPLYPFGFGLSYTTFSYGKPSVSASSIGMNGTVTIQVNVTNSGKLAGEEIVQLYIRDPLATRIRPVKELKGFQKISLAPGETKVVSFTLNKSTMQYFDENGKPQLEPGKISIFVGGNSRDLQELILNLQ
jgi:beta-glucosidase